MTPSTSRLIYLDTMATTPVDPRVIEQMSRYLGQDGFFANPSSSHRAGEQAYAAVEQARETVADFLNAGSDEIIWTSGATEANNLAIQGVAAFYREKGRHIITSVAEHKAVLDPCIALEKQGFEVTYLPVNPDGSTSLQMIENALRHDTILVSIMHINNEIGVINDIAGIGAITRAHKVLFHVDAAQSAGKVELDMKKMPVDLLSLSAHKVYGPKGIGALYVRRKPRARLMPLLYGGGHEQGLRSGTLATHQIVGMGEALRLAKACFSKDHATIQALHNQFLKKLQAIPGVYLNGDQKNRVPHNLNIRIQGVDSEALMADCDNIAFSAGSACNTLSTEPSHVLRAIGLSNMEAQSSVRFSLGRFTTAEEVDTAAEHIQASVARLRAISGVTDE